MFRSTLEAQRRRKEIAGADFTTTVASSRSSSSLRPSNWYFLLLEMGWAKLALTLLLAYLIATLVCMAGTMLVVQGITNKGDTSSWRVAFWFALSNVVTCGYPPHHSPEEEADGAFVLGTFQQLLGVVLQCFIFSVAVTRFQMAKADFFFSDKVCFTRRFGEPFVTVRIGNKRCNLIFHPDVRMVALIPKKTPEGETFFSIVDMELKVPSTMAGSITVAHKVDAHSPLQQALGRDGQLDEHSPMLQSVHFCVTIVATDKTFQAEVQGIKRYSAKQWVFRSRFSDVMMLHPDTGAPMINFEKFHDVEPLCEDAGVASPADGEDVTAEVCF